MRSLALDLLNWRSLLDVQMEISSRQLDVELRSGSLCLSLSILGGMESTRVGEGTIGAGIDREDAQGVSSEGLQN